MKIDRQSGQWKGAPFIMLTLYAKNMAGEILTLSLPDGVHSDTIRRAIYPDDPSSVRLLRRIPALKEEPVVMSDDILPGLMDELYEMASTIEGMDEEEEEKEEKEEEENLALCRWENQDRIEYWIQPTCLTVHLTSPLGGPYYAISDEHREYPLYPITLWIDKEEGGEKGEGGRTSSTVYTWSFLFSLRDGQYRTPSDYAMEVEGGGGDAYLALRASGTWHTTIFDAIRSDSSIPVRYKERILRAIYRKWVRLLRSLSRQSIEERRFQVMHPTEYVRGEKALFKQHYYALRASRHNKE